MDKFTFITPIVTAFKKNGSLDLKGNENILQAMLDAGFKQLAILGSTGEFCFMDDEQKREYIDLALDYCRGKAEVIVGTGTMSEKDTVALGNYALARGARAVLIVAPYYFKLDDKNIIKYFSTLANQITGDILLYNFPARTGSDISVDAVCKLACKHQNIVGYKDSVSDFSHTREIIKRVKEIKPSFSVFSGYDENFLHVTASEGRGCIGALGNIYPEVFAGWANAINGNDYKTAFEYQRIVNQLTAFYDINHHFVPVLKKAMNIRGIAMPEGLLGPFSPADKNETVKIEALINHIDNLLLELSKNSKKSHCNLITA